MLRFIPLMLWASGLTQLTAADAPIPDTSTESSLRRVADHVVRNTTRALVDRRTGGRILESEGLAPASEISIESKFNAWYYQTWLLTDAMRRVHRVFPDEAYSDYGEKNLDFIYQHIGYFERQHSAGLRAAPIGDGRLSPIGFYFEPTALWHTGLAPLVLERHEATGDARYLPYLKRIEAFLERHPRFEDGSYYRPGKGLMTDDPYMTVPFLVRRAHLRARVADYDAAAVQLLGAHKRTYDSERGLLRHMWSVKTKQPAGEFWGRANGWMVLAYVELLSGLPEGHPARNEVLVRFRELMSGLRRHQDPAGGWHQLLDHPESWIETSCTGMFVYGFARGVAEGWLDGSFASDAWRGWSALQTKVLSDGDLSDVCGSTDVGDVAYYLARPRLQGDLHGFGSFLLAGAEMVRLERAGTR